MVNIHTIYFEKVYCQVIKALIRASHIYKHAGHLVTAECYLHVTVSKVNDPSLITSNASVGCELLGRTIAGHIYYSI